ncbi:MAG: hypothetical protein E7Z94_03565 [Actinomyces ruminicola]|uniref:Uncharacterized protein n=1 Tax=Actinomyces ruminicola TaxID=332524 RepID=A0A1G9VLH0_9ACTO|nr:hypothetical protein [Actinomyces ruminicola]MBE6481449.1 hypothetical protein [Actinomyces ruminicola]SDM72950.1 hypothetical protein SAMN04487766_10652 [Actinomyces ruminicola]
MAIRYETFTDEQLQERRSEIRQIVSTSEFQERREAGLLLPREQALLDELEDLDYLSHDTRLAS